MRKLSITIAALVIMAMLAGTVACAPSELKPLTVDLGYVSNEWGGEEVIVADVFLTIKNPNSVPVTLDSLDFKLSENTSEIGMKTLVPKLIVPANGSIGISTPIVIDYSASLAVQKNYIGLGKDYVTAHVMAAPLWKKLGGKKPPLWDYPALGILAGINAGPSVADVKAGTADTAAIVGLYAKARGTIDAVQGGLDKVWAAAPAGPALYKVSGKATASYGNLSKDTNFNLEYLRN